MLRTISTFILLLALVSCSKKEHFVVGGEIEGLGSQMVDITYYADGGIHQEQVAAQDGRFAIRGQAATPTLCIVQVANAGEIATVVVSNGDKIRLTGQLADQLTITATGNSASEKISQWTAANADIIRSGNASLINRSIAAFVGENRKDFASTALMVTRFQTPGFEVLADSLITAIDVKARPATVIQNFTSLLASQLTKHAPGEVHSMILWARNDSVIRYNPISQSMAILAFRNPGTPNDSVASLLREISKSYKPHQIRIYEISTARDSAQWKQSTARDSAQWYQTWAPGSVAMPEVERLKVPRLPYFIVADSTGTQIYRGASAKAVRQMVVRRFGKPVQPSENE